MTKFKNIQNFDHELAHALIKRMKLRIDSLALQYQMPYQSLLAVLKGRRTPSHDLVYKLALTLNLNIKDLLK